MKRIHNLKRTIALFLAMLMAATSTAFADWDSFQGNNDNNGTTEIGITSSSVSTATVELPNNGAFTGVDVEPLVHGSRIYALYNGGTPEEDGTGGARLAAVNATTNSLIWTVPVDMGSDDDPSAQEVMDKRSNNVSQIATPVITEDGKTLYGTYTYTQNMLEGKTVSFSGDYSDGKINAKGTAVATITGVTLPDGYGNLQVGTDITSTGDDQQIGTVKIKNNTTVVQSFTGNSFGTYNFNIYYLDGTPVPGGTYTIEISVENTTDSPIPWSTVSLLVNRWGMFQVDGIDGNTPKVSMVDVSGAGYAGQANSPLSLADGKVYFGIYDGDRSYYQYDTVAKTAKKFTPDDGNQFYYAGAAIIQNDDGSGRVIFGSENGILYMLSADTFTLIGEPLKLDGAEKSRSSICYDSHELEKTIYLTSRNGLLWRVKLTSRGFGSNPQSVDIAQGTIANSVSTPVVSQSGLIYTSVYGYDDDNVGRGYVVATDRSNFSKANRVYSGDIVQCSPVVYTPDNNPDNTDYVYFTTNVANGAGLCYKCQYASFSASPVWSTPESEGNGYAVQGLAMGTYTTTRPVRRISFAVFGNDAGQLVIIK